MRASLLCLVVLAIVPSADAAPAPAPGLKAKERLEALKKRLPEVVKSWSKARWYTDWVVEVRVVRMLGPTQAKVVLMSRSSDDKERLGSGQDKVFTIFLDFYDGIWSATRFEGSWPANNDFDNGSVRFLMLAIDEAAEKP